MPIQTSLLTGEIGWNEFAGRYINTSSGRFITFKAVKDSLEVAITASRANMRSVSEQLRAGDVSLAEWQLSMQRDIKIIHTASAASARGGWAQMSQSDWGWVGQRVKEQYKYLNNFAKQIENGTQPMNGRLTVRADMYGGAGRATFEEMRRRYMRFKAGDDGEERRVLDPVAEHCLGHGGRDGCVELALLGWQTIGTLPAIGEAVCLTHCRCRFEFKYKGEIL